MILNLHNYQNIISVENLLGAWREFVCGKRNKIDIQYFERNLMDNIISLHKKLSQKTYKHGKYKHFKISDPKPRDIHKASVADRLVHHAIYRVLYPYFDRKFIYDSYSCRLGKGTHRAIKRFHKCVGIVSKNHTKQCWVLKCDIRKFFASIDHEILKNILAKHIADNNILDLLGEVIDSFNSIGTKGVGLPLGNLTSQLFVNIYMNEFDYFIKHILKIKHYIRYADDFLIFSGDKDFLVKIVPKIKRFLFGELKLFIHPNKISIKTIGSGVDFLGRVNFSKFKILRTKTKRRIIERLETNNFKLESVNSYLGLLSHGNTYFLRCEIFKTMLI